ncbi:MAG: metallophosphoesterase family protein [Erythrobacter sp.]|jgi:serine/threonine protein phosphatase 1|nr:metallophosphoesterase family protein [Erythrobacter sp.]
MIEALRRLITAPPPRPAPRLARVPQGERYYVIGDIHGRLDLFGAMIEGIEADDRAHGRAASHVILLGDLVDRGPDSAGVIAAARAWQERRSVRILMGNHEEMFLDSFERPEVLRHFLKHGGAETLASYGIDRKELAMRDPEDLLGMIAAFVPERDIDFIAGFEEMIIAGDYCFVHAGIDPTSPINAQKRSDLLWIRERFLNHEGPLAKVVVHGHTIFERVIDCGNRIGIDTGAFRSGVLTALVLEGDQRRIMQAIAHGPAQGREVEVFHGERARAS